MKIGWLLQTLSKLRPLQASFPETAYFYSLKPNFRKNPQHLKEIEHPKFFHFIRHNKAVWSLT